MSQLRQRNTDAKSAGTSKSAKDKEALAPDYAVVVSNRGYATLGAVCNQLSDAGFYVTVRPGQPGSGTAFVIVRLRPEIVAQTVKGPLTPAKRAWAVEQRIAKAGLRGAVPNQGFALGGETDFAPSFVRPYLKNPIRSVDITHVQTQYGDELATYFAFTKYALTQLVIPALLGVTSFYFHQQYNPWLVGALIIWSIFFAAGWSLRERELKATYPSAGDDSTAPLRTPRVEYRGLSPAQREFRRILYWPLLLAQLTVYALGLVALLGFEIFCTQFYNGPLKSVVGLFPAGANTVATQIFGVTYRFILNKWLLWEDYATWESYDGTKAQRLFYLSLLLNYSPILLTAYVYLPFGHLLMGTVKPLHESKVGYYIPLVPEFQLNTKRLVTQAFYYSVTNQLVGLATGVLLPLILTVFKVRNTTTTLAKTQSRAPFDVMSRFSELVSLLGYVVLVTPVWPLAGAAALVGTWIHIRASLVLLGYASRRPEVHPGHSIGRWQSNLYFLGGLGAVTGPTLVVMYGWTTNTYSIQHSFVDSSVLTVLAVAFVGENLFLAVSRVIQALFLALPVTTRDKDTKLKEKEGAGITPEDLSWKNIDLPAAIGTVIY